MKEENKKYGQEAYAIVEHAANVIGPRLPGSEGETKYAEYMAEQMEKIGVKSKIEKFYVAPRSAIGGLPYAGWAGVIISLASYLALGFDFLWVPIACFAALAIFWLISCCFLYSTWSDMFFRRRLSRNVYGSVEPEDGKVDYNIILSGHLDTCWTWNHSENIYKYRKEKPIKGLLLMYGKVGFGAVCFFAIALISIFMGVIALGQIVGSHWSANLIGTDFYYIFKRVLIVLPIITAIGCMFVTAWNDSHDENASPGAMDNATGCALAFEVLKYYKENPDKLPKGCRITCLNVGSEEAGLRGSMDFAREHKNDEICRNAWNINIDSVADDDFFEVVIKDDWQGCRFDTDLEKMFKETFKELEIPSKSKDHCIHNPAGGCDSTPMTKAGIKSVTFAAQDPNVTYYYHTFHDVPERFSSETVEKGFNVCLGVVDKIAKFQEEKGFNGPQKK